jgi:methylglyoxal synthase
MSEPKTAIAVLASHDSDEKNKELVRMLNAFCTAREKKELKKFQFIFTGGTFDRVLAGVKRKKIKPVEEDTKQFLFEECGVTRLPSRTDGGVTIMSYLIVQQVCSIIWPFLDPSTSHWLMPENLALLRLCDQWHVKKLMNQGSVEEWLVKELDLDKSRNRQSYPIDMTFIDGKKLSQKNAKINQNDDTNYQQVTPPTIDFPQEHGKQTIALISHDEMKSRMIEFAIDHERELARFKRILATGTTGREVIANTRTLEDKVNRYRSGPKGGDIEIATEILFGRCHVVIFFIDTLNPHPHIEDIRVVLASCMLKDKVRMLTNEMQARDWMERVVRS